MTHQHTAGQLCLAVDLQSASKKLEFYLVFPIMVMWLRFALKRKQLLISFFSDSSVPCSLMKLNT